MLNSVSKQFEGEYGRLETAYIKPEWLNALVGPAFLSRCRNGEIGREAGNAGYIPWAWHHHVILDNEKPAKYIACENAPMLENMGMLALREEAG